MVIRLKLGMQLSTLNRALPKRDQDRPKMGHRQSVPKARVLLVPQKSLLPLPQGRPRSPKRVPRANPKR